jgi:cytochrome c-type biogenesis protein CcmH/NrfF
VTRRLIALGLVSIAAGSLAPAITLTPAVAAGPPIAAVMAPIHSSRPSLPQIERQFMCPVCGVPLTVAESPQADRERVYIRNLYAQGDSAAQIRQALVNEFGPSVLVLPPHHGFDLSAYLVPLGVLVALLSAVAIMLVRWRRRAVTTAMAPAAAPLTTAESHRLDDDLAQWRG